ncbi:hypothetical protein ACX1DX_09350 [Tessaracoccus sp. Y36]|uniref:hypothetical protein n=1 Tax=Tessaracoccus sp. ZS01 TaxID=1906324 RepID=UPI00096D721F|nr:hypothetical protein [Tessaracoccus sp. ZS01]MCG6568170.1 hypothetical protein [Tessaracoccus sp. ZS01]OMG54092.1 hypothetical protein BJN44_11155 [Tessaracoccus sp. ZS01]
MESLPLLRTPIRSIVVDDSACDVNDLAVCGGVQVTVPATGSWAELVDRAVGSDWTGIEALAGLPGTVADVVRRNATAHGQQAADTVMSVRTWDLEADAQRTFAAVDCGFTDGSSRFQEELAAGSPRYEILDVSFLFRQGDLTRAGAEVAALLNVGLGERVPLRTVADAVTAS